MKKTKLVKKQIENSPKILQRYINNLEDRVKFLKYTWISMVIGMFNDKYN